MDKNKRFFIGQFLPQNLMVKYGLSQAANNFCYKIISLNCFDSFLSIPPLNVKDSIKFHEKENTIKFYTFRFFPHYGIIRYINLFFENIICYFKILKSSNVNIWFYNVYKGNILFYYLLKFFSNKKVFILLADYNPYRSSYIMDKLIIYAIKKSNGIISLSSRCSDFNNNFLAIPGILNKNSLRKDYRPFKNTKRFILSGTLNENTGLFLAIEVFKELPEFTLILSGYISDSLKNKVLSLIEGYNNIILMEFINDYKEYLNILDSVDFVLSLRDEKRVVNKYNFPSKILESLSMNIPVLSTMYYPELKEISYFYSKYEKNSVINKIKDLYNDKEQIVNASDNYISLLKYFTEEAWISAFNQIENYNNKN